MILLFGGTSDSLVLMEKLTSLRFPIKLSVATEYGRVFSKEYSEHLIYGRMDQRQIEDYIIREKISLIIDGTHPFADVVSTNAIQAASNTGIPYVRYERPKLKQPEFVEIVHSLQEACDLVNANLKTDDIIYLTTGSKTLSEYTSQLPINQIFARVLPTSDVIKSCEETGLRAHQIHGIKGPFTKEMNQALFGMTKATIIITKESGAVRGNENKISVAGDMGIRVILIERPNVDYPEVYTTVQEVIERAKSILRR